MWVARDKDNKLYLYEDKPYRDNDKTFSSDGVSYIQLIETEFPELKWEDEPIEVRLTEVNPTYTKRCPNCGEVIKYHYDDIHITYTDEDYIICTECEKTIYL